MKKIISLLLLLAMLTLAFASCGSKSTDPADTTAANTAGGSVSTTADAAVGTGSTTAAGTTANVTTAEPTTVATTTDKWEVIGPTIQSYADRARSLTLEFSSYVSAEKASKNDQYMAGPDEVDPGRTPALEQFVYERNKRAVELLGVNLTYKYWDYSWGKAAPEIKTVVQGQAADAPDLFVNMSYDINIAILASSFKDTWSLPGSYFDFDADGWMTAWMESMSLSRDRSYILAGDYFIDVLRAMGVLPVNIDMMDANADKLAPYILPEGQTLETGEKLSEYFFDYVDDGKWTWSTLHDLCEAIWVDTDGDGANSLDDVLGILGDRYGGMSAAIIVYSCAQDGLYNEYFVEDPDNTSLDGTNIGGITGKNVGRLWIDYPETGEKLGEIFDAVASVYTGKGAVTTYGQMNSTSPESPGLAYHFNKFSEGTVLFTGAIILSALEGDVFQSMTQTYSVVPLPKLSEDKEYHTIIHNAGDVGAMNVNTIKAKAVVLSAFLQYCTENSGEIREEFLEIVTKYKTTKYNQGTDRMFDIIYNGMVNGREEMIDDNFSGDDRWHSMMKSTGYVNGSDYLIERYEALKGTKQNKLNQLLNTWYSLPKVEPTAE